MNAENTAVLDAMLELGRAASFIRMVDAAAAASVEWMDPVSARLVCDRACEALTAAERAKGTGLTWRSLLTEPVSPRSGWVSSLAITRCPFDYLALSDGLVLELGSRSDAMEV